MLVRASRGSGGGGKSDSGTLTLSIGTNTIPLSFEPSRIICRFRSGNNPYWLYFVCLYDKNLYDSQMGKDYIYQQGSSNSAGSKQELPNTADSCINSVSSNGFTVKAQSNYTDFEWWAYE